MSRQVLVENNKKQKKRTETIIICAVLAIMLIIGAGAGTYIYFNGGPTDNEFNHYLDIANQYVESENYEAAIKNYWIAIEKNQTNERTYVSLGSVYEVIDQPMNAIDVYTLGYTRTQSNKLAELANSLSIVVYGRQVDFIKDDDTGSVATVVFNSSFINKIRSSSYADFIDSYGTPTVDNSTYKYVASFNGGSITVYYYNTEQYGTSIDGSTNTPKSGYRPNEISLSSLAYIFTDMSDSITYNELAGYDLNDLNKYYDKELGKDVVSFSYEDCKIVIECDKDGNIGIFSWNRIYPNLLVIKEEETKEKYDVEGQIIDAVTGYPVAEARIVIYDSEDIYTPISEYTTGYNGDYLFESLEEGDYEVYVSADGYIEESFEISVNPWEDNTDNDFTISPELNFGEIRIVLTWDGSPRDLDSYLDGYSSTGNEVHINYMNKGATDYQGNTIAVLDLDDRDGYGPETTTIYDVGGRYTFTVRDFHHTGSMAMMGATVKVYLGGESAPRVFEVPYDVVDGWEVFSINNGVIEEINSAVY